EIQAGGKQLAGENSGRISQQVAIDGRQQLLRSKWLRQVGIAFELGGQNIGTMTTHEYEWNSPRYQRGSQRKSELRPNLNVQKCQIDELLPQCLERRLDMSKGPDHLDIALG